MRGDRRRDHYGIDIGQGDHLETVLVATQSANGSLGSGARLGAAIGQGDDLEIAVGSEVSQQIRPPVAVSDDGDSDSHVSAVKNSRGSRSEERRVGKECRS